MSKNAPNNLKIPTIANSSIVFAEFLKVRRDVLNLSDGSEYAYYTLSTKPEAVAVLAITTEGKFIVNFEYRHPTQKILLSCPGGFLYPDENPLEGAKRELIEETGYSAENYELMGSAYPYPGMTGQKIHYVLATDAYWSTAPQLEPSEVLHCELKDPEEIYKMIKEGINTDATLCAGLLYYSLSHK